MPPRPRRAAATTKKIVDDSDDEIDVPSPLPDKDDVDASVSDDDFAAPKKKPSTSSAAAPKAAAKPKARKAPDADAPPAKKAKAAPAQPRKMQVPADDPRCAPPASVEDRAASSASSAPPAAKVAPPKKTATAAKSVEAEEASEPKAANAKPAAVKPAAASKAPVPKPSSAGAAASSSSAAATKPASKPAASSKAPAPAAPAVSSSGDGLLDYLREISMPTTAQARVPQPMLADHFKGSLTKSEAERRCADLVVKGSVDTREAGKVKLFWASQKDVGALSEAEAVALDREVGEARAQRAAHVAEVAKLQHAIKAMKGRRSLVEVKEEISAARAAVEAVSEELAALHKEAGGAGPMSAQEEAKVKKEYNEMRKLYLGRRRTAIECLENMAEARGIRRKKLMEDFGLEDDDDAGICHKNFPILG